MTRYHNSNLYSTDSLIASDLSYKQSVRRIEPDLLIDIDLLSSYIVLESICQFEYTISGLVLLVNLPRPAVSQQSVLQRLSEPEVGIY